MGAMAAPGAGISTARELTIVASIGAAALLVNIPLGYLREGTRKYSGLWFLLVHLSIPLIAFLRIHSRVTSMAIPVFAGCAVAGQIFGGRFRRKWKARGK